MVLPVLAPLTRQRAELIRRRWPYEDLIDQLRSESGAIACMPLDRWEDHRHALGEYYVHTQDVARPCEAGPMARIDPVWPLMLTLSLIV